MICDIPASKTPCKLPENDTDVNNENIHNEKYYPRLTVGLILIYKVSFIYYSIFFYCFQVRKRLLLTSNIP